MNTLTFPKNIKLLNLTPFKFCTCALITTMLKSYNKQLSTIYLDLFNTLINDHECEISKEQLYHKITTEVHILSTKHSQIVDPNAIVNSFIQIIEGRLNEMTTLNDLFVFFNLDVRELKAKDENNKSIIENGGIVDHFIRKCLFAFYKLSFENLVSLLDEIQRYRAGDVIRISLTENESEGLFEKQVDDLGFNLTNNDVIATNERLLESMGYKHKNFFTRDNRLGMYGY
jgi:hypothetical protein